MAASGAYVAYDSARTPTLFSSEIQAFRFANGKDQKVIPWPFGMSLDEAIAHAEAKDAKASK